MNHIRRHFRPQLQCPEPNCQFRGVDEEEMVRHGHIHKGTYVCESCSSAFDRLVYLIEHERTHCEDRDLTECPNKCGQWLKGTWTVAHELWHCPNRLGENRNIVHQCPICFRNYNSPGSLRSHCQTAHERRGQVVGFAASMGFGDLIWSAPQED